MTSSLPGPRGTSCRRSGTSAAAARLKPSVTTWRLARHRLARPQEERHPGPAPVVDLGPQRDERLGLRSPARRPARRGSPRTGRAPRAAASIGRSAWKTLRFSSRSCFARRATTGGSIAMKPEHLEQVRDDHVPVGAGLLVELGAALDPHRLRHVDLHVADVLAVPDRLEQPVGEPQARGCCRPTPCRGSGRCGRSATRRRPRGCFWFSSRADARSVPNGFSMITRALVGQAGRAEHGDHGREGGGRDGQVEQPPRRAADRLLGRADRGRQRLGSSAVGRAERQRLGEVMSTPSPAGLAMPNSVTASRACSRNCSSVSANWPAPSR